MSDDLCIVCGKEATLLCDFVLGLTDGNRAEQRLLTCDAPLCEDCTTRVGTTHVCDRRRGGGCSHDTLDRCPLHAGKQENPKWPMTESEAVAERCRMRFTIVG